MMIQKKRKTKNGIKYREEKKKTEIPIIINK